MVKKISVAIYAKDRLQELTFLWTDIHIPTNFLKQFFNVFGTEATKLWLEMFIFRVSHSHASLKFVYDIGSFKATTIDQRINRALNLCIKTTFTKSQSGTADASVAK